MNREIKFRGKRKDNGEWVYGCLFQYKHSKKVYIVLNEYSADELMRDEALYKRFAWHEVLPETVGQSTGLKDKNGVEGFDHDKVSFGRNYPTYQIKWSICNAEFYLESMNEQKETVHISHLLVGVIIGNIHENPDLKSNQGPEPVRDSGGPADSD